MKVTLKNLSLIITTGLVTSYPLMAEIGHLPQNKNISPHQTALEIYHKLLPYILPVDINRLALEGKMQYQESYNLGVQIPGSEKLKAHIAESILNNRRIRFLLVGFPFKSQNTSLKVLNGQADLAERKSLEYLHRMIMDMQAVYKPGAEIYIFCDGLPYAQLLGVSPQDLETYIQNLRALVQDLPGIHILSADNLQSFGIQNGEDFMNHVEKVSISKDVLETKIQKSPKEQKSFMTLINRLKEEFDYPAGKTLIEKSGAQGLKDIALEMMRREGGLRLVIKDLFPENKYIRLSVHYTADLWEKVGIKLSPDSTITPYHGVLYLDRRGRWHIAHRKSLSTKDFRVEKTRVNGVDCAFMQPR